MLFNPVQFLKHSFGRTSKPFSKVTFSRYLYPEKALSGNDSTVEPITILVNEGKLRYLTKDISFALK